MCLPILPVVYYGIESRIRLTADIGVMYWRIKMLFRYEHAARNWAYQQTLIYGRKVKVIEIKETPEGAKWKVLED
jgi:hypothetical protein